jgi:type I restriction enzyme S subunit
VAQFASVNGRFGALPATINRLKATVLAAACRGALTEDWRLENPAPDPTAYQQEILALRRERWLLDRERVADITGKPFNRKTIEKRYTEPAFDCPEDVPELPASWSWVPVDALAFKVVDGVHKKPDYVDDGIPFVSVSNLTAGPGLSLDTVRYVTPEDHKKFIERADPERGDILISKDGTLGEVRGIRTEAEFSIFVSVALVKPVTTELTDYLELAFSSPQVQRQMLGVGSGLQHIHLRDLRADCIPLPPKAEQQEIVRRVRAALETADLTRERVVAAERTAAQLEANAFRRLFEGAL